MSKFLFVIWQVVNQNLVCKFSFTDYNTNTAFVVHISEHHIGVNIHWSCQKMGPGHKLLSTSSNFIINWSWLLAKYISNSVKILVVKQDIVFHKLFDICISFELGLNKIFFVITFIITISICIEFWICFTHTPWHEF